MKRNSHVQQKTLAYGASSQKNHISINRLSKTSSFIKFPIDSVEMKKLQQKWIKLLLIYTVSFEYEGKNCEKGLYKLTEDPYHKRHKIKKTTLKPTKRKALSNSIKISIT